VHGEIAEVSEGGRLSHPRFVSTQKWLEGFRDRRGVSLQEGSMETWNFLKPFVRILIGKVKD
jgi:hypothetical protein